MTKRWIGLNKESRHCCTLSDSRMHWQEEVYRNRNAGYIYVLNHRRDHHPHQSSKRDTSHLHPGWRPVPHKPFPHEMYTVFHSSLTRDLPTTRLRSGLPKIRVGTADVSPIP
jgi:hypothetical protein